MNKITCNVIKDILPLYIDGVVSEDTQKIVDEHLAECSLCRDEMNKLKKTLVIPTNEEIQQETVNVLEKSISSIGLWLTEVNKNFKDKQDLINANEELQNTIDTLTEQNNILSQNQAELTRLEELYNLDEEYADYPKVAARIISKDPGNWYDTFMINKGSKDGIPTLLQAKAW